jgi:hypothetical protein
MRVAAILAALGLVTAPLGARVETRAADGRIQLQARAAPLCEILDDLARHTDMKVVYEGVPPRDLITTNLERGTLVEVLLAVLEGLGLAYAIQLDATSTRAVTLVMVASGPRRPASGPTASSARPATPVLESPPEVADLPTDDGFAEPTDPSTVVRDRVATDPRTGEPYPTPPDIAPTEPPQPPADVHVQGYPAGARSGPPSPGLPNPQPQPTPAVP